MSRAGTQMLAPKELRSLIGNHVCHEPSRLMTGAFRAASLVPSFGATSASLTRTFAGDVPLPRLASSSTIAAVVAALSSLRPAELATTPTILPERPTRYWADFAGFFTAFAAFTRFAGISDSSRTATTWPPAAGANRIQDRTSAALIVHLRFFVATVIGRAMRSAWAWASSTAASSTRGRVVAVVTGRTVYV